MAVGQVFTPLKLAGEVLERVPGRPLRILDPACGTGNFLQAAARKWPGAELVGLEADLEAGAEARCWLQEAIAAGLAAPGSRIEIRDALTAEVHPEFDLVCGNPPYASAHQDPGDRQAIRRHHATPHGSFDLAVPFVERAARWLTPGGWLALVVTNKLLVKDYASRLRIWLLGQVAIREIWDLASHKVFAGHQIEAAVILAQRADRGPIRIVLADKRGGHKEYPSASLPEGRWEVYATPEVTGILAMLEGPALGEIPGVDVRDGVLGRDYHTVALSDGDPEGLPVVGVGRILPGRIAWDKPLTRAGHVFVDPTMRVTGSFKAFCDRPKILVRGVCRRLMAAYVPDPAVPLTGVRAIALDPALLGSGSPDPEALVAWLHTDLAGFLLQVRCRSDRIPGGSFNISKRWLEALPVPLRPPILDPEARVAVAEWMAAFGV